VNKTIYQALFQYYMSGVHNRFPNLSSSGLETHLVAAIEWILYAQSKSLDGGISASYNILKDQWAPSYPETTGYTIPTFFRFAKLYERDDILNAVFRMAEYELEVQLDEGGFPCIKQKGDGEIRPIAFDTGQILFGLMAAYEEAEDNRYLDAAIRAADWLVAHQMKDGSWKDYHSYDSALTIDTRVAWSLILLHDRVKNRNYQEAGYRQLEWVLKQQNPNGWFRHCSFHPNKPPITHTLAYTIEGLLESGILLGESHFVIAAQKAADAILDQLIPSGFLAGAFNKEWKSTVSWSCLTGSSQMALIWLRLAKLNGLSKYKQAADRTIRYIASTQYLKDMPRDIRGGIAGSWPVYGGYEGFKFPNWAAKFFADTVMALQEA
jgi:uncharacterized protein YyaL (SSP411 family)